MLPLQKRLADYLANFAATPAVLMEEKASRLPLFLRERFRLYSAPFGGRRFLFAVEAGAREPVTPGEYEKLAATLRSQLGEPAVLVLDHLPTYARNRLVRLGIPFVVPGSQLYLPMAVINLRERCPAPGPTVGKRLTPTAQCLVLYHLQRESLEGRPLKEIAEKIDYSPIMLTKVKRELEAAELCEARRQGRAITLHFLARGQALWEQAQPFLASPVRKTHWLQWSKPGLPALAAGLTALSQLTAIADDRMPTFALSAEALQAGLEKKTFLASEGPEAAGVRMESWSYEPNLLGKARRVDPLSLHLSLRDSLDERVQQQLADLIDQIKW